MKNKGVSDEELEWTGATEKFGNSKPVTKEEIVKHFEDTDFDFEIVTGRPSKVDEEFTIEDDVPYSNEDAQENSFWNWVEENYPHEVDLADDVLEGADWDEWYNKRYEEFSVKRESEFTSQRTHLDYAFEGKETENYRELVFRLPKRFQKVNMVYKNTHFPTIENPVMHIRLADIQSAEKAKRFDKNLLLDEVQADAAQEAKNKGRYTIEEQKILDEKSAELKDLKKAQDKELNIPRSMGAEREKAFQQRFLKIQSLEEEIMDLAKDMNKRIPDLPYKNDRRWGLQGLRKGMIVAAEEGYDNLVLTTGKIQAVRNNKRVYG